MPSLSQRSQPRVKYPVEVRLSAPVIDHVLVARSLNLSPTGILLEVRESLDVGTRVTCEIPLPGGTRKLAGLVVRVEALPLSLSGVGLGIRFVDLEPATEQVLRGLVQTEDPVSRLARVRFEGVRETWRSQAVPTADGIRLATVLPFLRTGCEVSVSFVSGSSRVLSRGIVRDVSIEPRQPDGVPRLAVNVQFPRENEPDYLPMDTGEEVTAVESPHGRARITATRAAEGQAANTRPSLDARRLLHPSRRRTLRLRGRPRPRGPQTRLARRPLAQLAIRVGIYSVAAVALVATGSALARWSAARPPAPVALTTASNDGIPALRSSAASEPAPRDTPAPPPAAPVGTSPTAAPSREIAAEPSAEPTTSPPSVAGAPSDPLTGLPPLPPGTPGPRVSYRAPDGSAVDTPQPGSELTVEVPFAGSAEGAIHYALAQPRGVAVTLPNAHSVLPVGRHAVFNEGFRYVWIREQEQGGIQVRFMFAYRTPVLRALEVDEGMVRVRVAPTAGAETN
jgi:hypothetical protein